jgi:non-canonical poly(A) RNA polymerase PAPD5/7
MTQPAPDTYGEISSEQPAPSSDRMGDDDFVSLWDVADENESDGEQEPHRSRSWAGAFQDGAVAHNLPPWMDHHVDRSRVNPLVALHNEVVGFCQLMEPHPSELKQRDDLAQKFKELVHSVFGSDCQVEVFGSQVTGLCLPTSDIDIAIQIAGEEEKEETKDASERKVDESKKEVKDQEKNDMENWDAPGGSHLQRLAEALREQWQPELSYLEVIENTRIPLVKFTHGPTNISVDVCFNQKTGPMAAALMKQYMDAMPPLRPLTFVLKYFLASRGLNEPYSGGVGSFMLQVMIVSFLQNRERDAFNFRRPSLYNLGALLVEFLELYSTDFNYITTGLSVRYDGFYFPKGASDRKENFWQPQRPFSMAIENPLETLTDVGKPSFRMQMVQRSFEVAFKFLLAHVTEPSVPSYSILSSILQPTDEMRERSTLARLKPLKAKRPPVEPQRKRQRYQ